MVKDGDQIYEGADNISDLRDVTIIISDVSVIDCTEESKTPLKDRLYPTTRVVNIDLGTLEGQDPSKVVQNFLDYISKYPNVLNMDNFEAVGNL